MKSPRVFLLFLLSRAIRVLPSATVAWLLLASMLALVPDGAQAIPLFTTQVGVPSQSCHAVGGFPELTPFGRDFKLRGYTLGSRKGLPFGGSFIASRSTLKNGA